MWIVEAYILKSPWKFIVEASYSSTLEVYVLKLLDLRQNSALSLFSEVDGTAEAVNL